MVEPYERPHKVSQPITATPVVWNGLTEPERLTEPNPTPEPAKTGSFARIIELLESIDKNIKQLTEIM